MLNEDRIKLMTGMAAYEAHEGKKNMAIARYFRSDYIGVQMLKSFFYATLSFAVVLGMYFLYNIDELMQNIYEIDLFVFARGIVVYYVGTVAVYSAITYLMCTIRYARAKKNLRCYYRNLKKLNNMYHGQR